MKRVILTGVPSTMLADSSEAEAIKFENNAFGRIKTQSGIKGKC